MGAGDIHQLVSPIKRNRIMIKRILNISLLVVSILGLFISLAFSTRESDKFPCQNIDIKVDDTSQATSS